MLIVNEIPPTEGLEFGMNHPPAALFDQLLLERTYLKNVLQLTGGNISRAAQFAGRYRADFYKMLRKYGLHPSSTKEAAAEEEMEDTEGEQKLIKS